MANDVDLDSLEGGENTILREAVEALRLGDRIRARDLLTRMLKADQNNATYWVWLSAAVDTQKERLYCLQSALRIDPQNAAAKRGLTVLGALPPDDSVQPFPVNRPRSWEEKLVIPKEVHEKTHGWANPVTRSFIILGIAAAVIVLFVGGYMLMSKNARPRVINTFTRGPTITLTFTPTLTPEVRTATPTFMGATPLAAFLVQTYTATPLYAVTEHPVLSRASFEAGLRSLVQGKYDIARVQFNDVLKNEPNAADVYFFIGESYMAENNPRAARESYQEAINRITTFAPVFLGRARANLVINPEAEVVSDLDEAIRLDPNYTEAYIERGRYLLKRDPPAAVDDLNSAVETNPNSALAFLYLSQAQLLNGEADAALDSAKRANQLDVTLVPAYLALAKAYLATGQIEAAVSPLQTYTIYEPTDTSAFLSLGIAYNAARLYQQAVDMLDKAIGADRKNAEAYFQRGWAYLNLEKSTQAIADFKLAVAYDPTDFDSYLGMARAYFQQGKAGDAYVIAETNALPLAKGNDTKAKVYYWESIFLDAMGDAAGERASWTRLVALPPDVMPAEWRTEAFKQLGITATPTKTTVRTPTPTKTKKP